VVINFGGLLSFRCFHVEKRDVVNQNNFDILSGRWLFLVRKEKSGSLNEV
jgi:hypothetical protein